MRLVLAILAAAAAEEDCFFDSVSAAAMSLLQRSATIIGRDSSDTSAPELAGAPLPATPLLRSLVVPLRRVTARSTSWFSSPTASFYVGEVAVGNPGQRFDVLFDTSSVYSWIAHSSCTSAACKEHRRFQATRSVTATDVSHNGTQLGQRLLPEGQRREELEILYTQADLGEGRMRARFVRDSLCLGRSDTCVELTLAAAGHLDDAPFRALPADGIVGLSLDAGFGRSSNFLGQLFASSVLPQFGIWLGRESGEVHLGGHELADLAGPLQWVPVSRPEQGYWQAQLHRVLVDGVDVVDCSGGCHGIVDTGVAHIGVQKQLLPSLQTALAGCAGPELAFEFTTGLRLTLGPEDYMTDCQPQLGALDLDDSFIGVFTFGASLLHRYYAAFDWQERRLGFAPLSQSPVAGAAPRSMAGAVVV